MAEGPVARSARRRILGARSARRMSLGLPQEELAVQAGVSRPPVMAIERGKETARIGLAPALRADLGIQLFAAK